MSGILVRPSEPSSGALTSPFITHRNPALRKFIELRLIPNDFPSDSNTSIVAKRILQLSAIFVAAAAQGGMVNINLDAAGKNKVLGDILVVSNLTSFGSFYAYCSWRVLEQAFRNLSPEEKQIFQSEKPACVGVTLKVVATALGLFSQVPMAYAAYDSNNKSLFYAITRFLDAGLPSLSLYLGAKAFFSNIGLSDTEKQIEDARAGLVKAIRERQSILPTRSPNVLDLVRDLKGISDSNDYLSRILECPAEAPSISRVNEAAKKVMWGTGHLSNLFVMALYGIITFHATSLISDDRELMATSIILVIASKFYLWKDSVSRASRQFPDDVRRLSGAEVTPTISQAFLPKTDAIATVGAYALGAFSYGSMKYFCDLYSLGDAGTAASSVATALMAKNTFTAVKNGLVESGLSRWGNEDQKEIIKLSRTLERLIVTLQGSNRQEFAKYLLSLSPELQRKLQIGDRDTQELKAYVSLKGATVELDDVELRESSTEDELRTPLHPEGATTYGQLSDLPV